MTASVPLEVQPSAFSGLIGLGRRDTTPPDGIYARMWGAASHDFADGVHRPLTATALALRPEGGRPRVLVALDIALLGDLGGDVRRGARARPVREALALEPGELLVNCSHTHAAPWAAMSRSHNPGGELIGPYLDQLSRAILDAGREAIDGLAPATLTWATGRCDLARNRDLPDPASEDGRIVCGFNPAGERGRHARRRPGRRGRRRPRARHDRQLRLPPDDARVGEHADLARTTSERCASSSRRNTGGAPCVFLQGASGELGPAHQYVGDPAVADQHGRRLGFSALAALEGMLPAGQDSATTASSSRARRSPSGCRRRSSPRTCSTAAWSTCRCRSSRCRRLEELEAQRAATDDRAVAERLFRKIQIVRNLSGGDHQVFPAWVWRVGDSLFVAHANEAYSCFQEDLRAAFPHATVVVMNTSGAEVGYLYPPELDGLDLYQVWQTPSRRRRCRRCTESCIGEGRRLFDSS